MENKNIKSTLDIHLANEFAEEIKNSNYIQNWFNKTSLEFQKNKPKETKVFVCNINEFEEYSKQSISADIIDDFDNSTILRKDFIDLAERTGMVYSLVGFQNAINNEELSFTESYVYITNNY